ncbi:MAG TPA: hypothetical protein PKD58_01255 [Candidatus Sumerlaeota bacterium]|nr:hypothetical protein [Candidatus Sumerlaeota bacterium]
MPYILLFQRGGELLSLSEISQGLSELLGLACSVEVGGKRIAAGEWNKASAEFHEGKIYVELPDLEVDEGTPLVSIEATPRLDRDDSIQKIIDEILQQDETLKEELDRNKRDVMLTFDESPAGMEAGYALAYTIASETGSGILLPSANDEDGTLWFEDAEDFADEVFNDDEEGDEDEEED